MVSRIQTLHLPRAQSFVALVGERATYTQLFETDRKFSIFSIDPFVWKYSMNEMRLKHFFKQVNLKAYHYVHIENESEFVKSTSNVISFIAYKKE